MMAKTELLVIIAFAALACATEVDDADQKKRGAGKGNTLNSIPTGAQKPDYTYSIYSQNPSSQAGVSSSSYQSQVPNSFYPNQASQYYTSSSTPSDTPPQYAQQPQINLLPPSSSQFIPINFVPNPGYQSKYQLVPSQAKGNIQLAILQPPNAYPTPSIYPSYSQNFFTPNPTTPISPHQNFLGSLSSPGQFNIGSNLPYSLGNLGQPSTMVVLAQPNPSLYGNYLYNNPSQGLYNYFPSNNQPKYGFSYSPQGSSDLQIPITQNVPKEENEISSANANEYTSAPSDSSSSYKTSYPSSRSSYLKH